MIQLFSLRFSRSFLISFSTLILCVLVLKTSYSQSSLKIFGQVVDRDGPVPKVMVNVENTVYQATTGTDGYYYIYNIPPGDYRLSCRLDDIIISTGDRVIVGNGPPVRRDIFFGDNLINFAPIYTEALPPQKSDHRGFNVKVYDIENRPVESIESVLKDIPGLNVIVSPATGEIFVSAGGIRPEGVNILIDGRKINSLLTGRADLGQIPLKAVTQIEYYSPGVTYTSTDGGLGGTLNFITANVKNSNSFEISARKGSYIEESYSTDFDYYESFIGGLKGIWEKGFIKNDYDYIDYYGQTQTRQNAFVKHNRYFLSYSNSFVGNYLSLSGFVYTGENGVPGRIIELKNDAVSNKETVSLGSELSRRLGEKTRLETKISYLARKTKYQDYGSFIHYDTEYNEREYELTINGSYFLTGELGLNSSANYIYSRLEGIDYLRPQTALGKVGRDVYKLLGGVDYNKRVNKLLLSAGASYSENVVENTNYSSSAMSSSIAYDAGITIGIRSAYARSFRLPGLAELHWQEDVFILPNPDLKPEKSHSFTSEIFSTFSLLGNWRLSLEYRDLRYKDLIYWRRSQGIKYKPQNVSASDFFSATAAVSYKIPGEYIEIDFSRVNCAALNREDDQLYYGKYITFQPLYTNRLAVKFNYRGLYMQVNMFDSSHRYFLEENTKQLEAYTLVDFTSGLTLKYKFITTIWEFKIKNLTDIEYELLEYQPMPPRSYYLSLTFKL